MDDDLNTADALSAVFELTREINAWMGAHQDATKAFLAAAHEPVHGADRRAQPRCSSDEDAAADPDADRIEALIAQRAAREEGKELRRGRPHPRRAGRYGRDHQGYPSGYPVEPRVRADG